MEDDRFYRSLEFMRQWCAVLAVEVVWARGKEPTRYEVSNVLADSAKRAQIKTCVAPVANCESIGELEAMHAKLNFKSTFESIVSYALSPDAELCPKCMKNYVTPGTKAAQRYGVCERCHRKALAEAADQLASDIEQGRAHARARQRVSRARKKTGA